MTRCRAVVVLWRLCTVGKVRLQQGSTLGCPQDPKENSFPAQKGTHEANLMLASSNRSEASSVGGPSD